MLKIIQYFHLTIIFSLWVVLQRFVHLLELFKIVAPLMRLSTYLAVFWVLESYILVEVYQQGYESY